MSGHRKRKSRNANMVLASLAEGARPLSAYQIMERLRPQGVSSPATVYRALDRLMTEGLVHRVESLNAYVVTCSPRDEPTSVFAVCRACGDTAQVNDSVIADRLCAWGATNKFSVERMSLEITGCCRACARPPVAAPEVAT